MSTSSQPPRRVTAPTKTDRWPTWVIVAVVATVCLVIAAALVWLMSDDDSSPAPSPDRVQQSLIDAGFMNPELIESAEDIKARNLAHMDTEVARDTYRVALGQCKAKVSIDENLTIVWRDVDKVTVTIIKANAEKWGVEHCFAIPQAANAGR